MKHLLSKFLVISSLLVAQPIFANTLTFSQPDGELLSPGTEGIFTYSASGPFNVLFYFNGVLVAGGGGTVEAVIARNDTVGGLFKFDSADFGLFATDSNFGGGNIAVEGFLQGVSQGTDSFPTAASFATMSSANLNGKLIDQLVISLFGTRSGSLGVDNVVLTLPTEQTSGVPDHGSSALLLGGTLAGCFVLRRRLDLVSGREG